MLVYGVGFRYSDLEIARVQALGCTIGSLRFRHSRVRMSCDEPWRAVSYVPQIQDRSG